MPKSKRASPAIAVVLAKSASALPGVVNGIACAGTSLEADTYNVAGKSFLFVGAKDARLKLGPSLADAKMLSTQHPESVRVGNGGWVTIRIGGDGNPDARTLDRWVKESHQIFGGSRGAR